MAIQEPVLHQFMSYLAYKKAEQEANPSSPVRIELTRDFITQVREAFHQSIIQGERSMHILAHLLSSHFLGSFELHSNVIGALPGPEERPFLIREHISQKTLLSVTDIDLGNLMLDNFRYRKDQDWVPLELSANFIEYIPLGRPSLVNRLTSRVKAEEELWNKVTDELFALDQLVSKDKHLRRYSKFVKDIFGIKIVCDDEASCMAVHSKLEELTAAQLDAGKLADFGIQLPNLKGSRSNFDPDSEDADDFDEEAGALHFVETKDYLNCGEDEAKKTGWRALKSVVMWHDRMFEIQVQPLSNYYLELDHMSGPSHSSFKLRRDAMRDEVAQRIPFYGFYRDLLKMLFMEDVWSFDCKQASVIIS